MTTVLSGGNQKVWGVTTSDTISSGGIQEVNSGGLSVSASVAGTQYVNSTASASQATVVSGGGGNLCWQAALPQALFFSPEVVFRLRQAALPLALRSRQAED